MLRWAGKSGSMLGHSLRGRRMRKQFVVLAVGCLTLGLMAALGSGQMDKASRPSPPAKASCALADGKTIAVDYSSPRACRELHHFCDSEQGQVDVGYQQENR